MNETVSPQALTWIEINKQALCANIKTFKRLAQPKAFLQVVVKSNAYGHGLETVARAAAEEGVDFFGVHSVDEATALEQLHLGKRILVLGYVGKNQAGQLVQSKAEATVYNVETLEALSAAAIAAGTIVRCHVKVETGVNRQGILPSELNGFVGRLFSLPGLELAGVSTHFANIEDTTDHSYALMQLRLFQELAGQVRKKNPNALRHCACSAAILTMPETAFDMIRVGISLYGLWSSKETMVSCRTEGHAPVQLVPVLTWKTKVAQIKRVETGAFVGYGCTFRAGRPMKIAVLPIGYADGYDRRLSGVGHVLVRGQRAAVVGRICMNLFMVDVTDIPGASLEDEVVLIGTQGAETITAVDMASRCNTIPYDIVARLPAYIPRIAVPGAQKMM